MMQSKLSSTNYMKELPQLYKRRHIHYCHTLPTENKSLHTLCMFASHLFPNISSFAISHLTKRALYKMYEITGSCRRLPRMSRPLMSSVTEPPLHSWEGDRETPVTRPSFTTLDYDSYWELAHTQVRESNAASHSSMTGRTLMQVGFHDKLRSVSVLHVKNGFT